MITVKAEQIGKKFRKFNGDLNLQVDDKWINLPAQNEAKLDLLLELINKNQLTSFTMREDGLILDIEKNLYKNADSEVLEKLGKVYRHG